MLSMNITRQMEPVYKCVLADHKIHSHFSFSYCFQETELLWHWKPCQFLGLTSLNQRPRYFIFFYTSKQVNLANLNNLAAMAGSTKKTYRLISLLASKSIITEFSRFHCYIFKSNNSYSKVELELLVLLFQ